VQILGEYATMGDFVSAHILGYPVDLNNGAPTLSPHPPSAFPLTHAQFSQVLANESLFGTVLIKNAS